MLSAGTSNIFVSSAAYLGGPSDVVTLSGTTTVAIDQVAETGLVDTFLLSYLPDATLGGPLCNQCVGPTCPTVAPLPNNTQPPAQTLPPSSNDAAGAPLPTWAYAVIGVAAVLLLVGIIVAIIIVRRRHKDVEVRACHSGRAGPVAPVQRHPSIVSRARAVSANMLMRVCAVAGFAFCRFTGAGEEGH